MLPALPPHEDKCYIVQFVSDRSEPCKRMAPLVKQLQQELKLKVRTINVSHNPAFLQLYECVGGNECGNLPFYYNRRTAQAICGHTRYVNLQSLALGEPVKFRDNYEELEVFHKQNKRGTREQGWKDFLFQKMNEAGK